MAMIGMPEYVYVQAVYVVSPAKLRCVEMVS